MRTQFQQIREQLCKEYEASLDLLSKKNFGHAGLTKGQIDSMTDAYRQGVSDVLVKLEEVLAP